jgi:ubiquinone/menaquinone biosynthesis C-methylase UbiE
VESVNFDRAADFYDATRALPADSMAELTEIAAAALADRQPCLEIGIGTGRIALPLHESGIALAGADISEAMLRRLVANAGGRPPFPVVRADASRLPVRAGSFGSVLAVHVLHLIPQWRVAVDEALRVLRPGGALVASFPAASAPTSAGSPPWREAVREALRRHGIARVRHGAGTADGVAAYLGGRAAARQLPPVTLHEIRTLEQTVTSLERQLYSWTWPYAADQVRAAGHDIRQWAARENVPLDTAFEEELAIGWWVFETSG